MAADQWRDLGGKLSARGMRDDRDARMAPERMLLRQRFLAEHIERCGDELAAIQRGDEIGIDDLRTAAEIDYRGGFRQQREILGAEDVLRLGRGRQEVHDDLAAAEESRELVVTVKYLDAVELARTPHPSGGLEAE